MREFSFVIEEALQRGLVPDDRTPRNTPFLQGMTGLIPTPYGAVSPEVVAYPITTPALTMYWPFPQLFRGRSVTLLCYPTTIYEVDESDWSTSSVTVYDWTDFENDQTETADSITTGGAWQFMDFYNAWMLFNGQCCVFKLPHLSSNVFVDDTVTVNAGLAYHEGRAFMGGFDSSDQWSSAWQSFFADYDDNVPDTASAIIDFASGAGQNWVWWSSIGGGDLLFLLSQKYLTYGSLDSTDSTGWGTSNPFVHELWKRNEMGFRPMPWRGQVQAFKQLGNAMVVYGEDGITPLNPYSSPVPTFGLGTIAGLPEGLGIAGRAAVGGDEQKHVFVDNAGGLWRVTANMQAEYLNYAHIFSDMLSDAINETIVVSYDPREDHFWITDGTDTYVLTSNGLGGPVDQQPSTLVVGDDGNLYGAHSDDESDSVALTTGEFDLAERGRKSLKTIQCAMSGLTNRTVTSYGRVSDSGSYVAAPSKPINAQGVAFPTHSFVDGKLKIEGDVSNDDAHISRIEVRYQADDKRYRRGTKGIPEDA
jgi:hypothetical protein